MKIAVRIVDDVGGKKYDYSKLTPDEAAQLRALSEKALVYTEE